MPWPTAPDRLSPSGPILPIGGGILKIGGDCVEERQEIPADELTVINRLQGPPAVPVQIPVPDYTPGNALWIQSSVNWVWQPSEDETALVVIVPALQVGLAPKFMDNTATAFTVNGTGPSAMGDALGMTTTQALVIPDPEEIDAGITVAFLIVHTGGGDLLLLGNPAESPDQDPGRCYFTVAEMNPSGVIKACFVPVIDIPP